MKKYIGCIDGKCMSQQFVQSQLQDMCDRVDGGVEETIDHDDRTVVMIKGKRGTCRFTISH